MKLLIDHNKKFLFRISNKCGTKVIFKMFYDYLGVEEKNFDQFFIGDYGKLWGIHGYYFNVLKKSMDLSPDYVLDGSYYKVKFVRCPYDRMVSSFIYLGRTKSPLVAPESSFKMFLKSINNNPKKYLADPHLTPQHLEIENDVIYNKISRIENIKNEVKEINNILGTDFKLKSYNLIKHHHIDNIDVTRNMVNVPFEDIDIKNVPLYSNFYDEETRELVEAIYKADIKIYGYSWSEFVNRKIENKKEIYK